MPPVEALYHLKVPAIVLFTVNTTVPAPQREPATAVGVAGNVFTVATTAVRGELSHVPL